MTPTTRNITLGSVGAVALATAVTFFVLSGPTRVGPGDDLQAAINAAQCGDTLELEAGAAYPANLTLPNKPCGDQWITIQSSRAAELPVGLRVSPAQSSLMAHLQSTVNAEPVVKTAAGANHYKFVGIQLETASESVFVYDLVRFGQGRGYPDAPEQVTRESVPHHLVIDRSYIAGRPAQQTQRGVSLNCSNCGITNSYVENIMAKGMDTQAVCGWNGTLRAYVLNNTLIATGENVMFGGSDPASEDMIPTDIEVRRNHIYKPMEWKGKGYTIKNLVEVKNGRGITIDGNLIENNWGGEGQSGIGLLATVRNQEGSAPYSIITNYVLTNNIIRNTQGAINLQGLDNEKPSQQSHGAWISNNVFDQSGTFLTIHGFDDVAVDHNTHLQSCPPDWSCNTILFYGNHQSHGFSYTFNVTQEHAYGIRDEAGTEGVAALEKWAPGYQMVSNVIATPYTKNPPGNDYPPSLTITSDYRTSYNAGANIDTLLAAQAGGGVSQPTPQPSPSVTPSVTVSPSPSATASLVPSPSPIPSPTAVPTSTSSPRPSPSATVLPICKSNQVVGNPPTCKCVTGMKGQSGKCR